MDIAGSLAIVTLAALTHASFQLSVSVLSLLSGHSIGAKQSQAKLLRLTSSFLGGVAIMTILILSFTSLALIDLFGPTAPKAIWSIGCGLLVGIALAVWLFYYRKEKGTSLWIPRDMASYLVKRTKATKISAEAFSLGLSSVVGEILFIIAPLFIAALALIRLSPNWQLIGIGIYTLVSMLPIIAIWILISGGHTIARIQKWREDNKYFLQFIAGAGLIVLSFFVYMNEIITAVAGQI
ncbi:hypothetical protein HGB24_01320 [Candidatus Saccharibacteria bacterium]|nr:hypothetical protein [Candidatus Saccharibacteria bacterium]